MQSLDSFIKSIGKMPCLFESFEFDLFIRYTDKDLEKQIDHLLTLKPQDILAKFQAVVKIQVDG